MIRQILIEGKKRPFVMSMATVEYYLFNRDVPLADLAKIFKNMTTKDLPELILQGFIVGAILEGNECDLTVKDLLKAGIKGEINLIKLSEELSSVSDEEKDQGK